MASRGVNKVTLLGYVGNAPIVKKFQNGILCSFSVATSDKRKNKSSGEYENVTEWHRVVMFGKLAEIAEMYLTKGCQVYVEGSLRTRDWVDEQVTKQVTEIIASSFQILGSKTNDSKVERKHSYNEDKNTYQEDFDDEIPF